MRLDAVRRRPMPWRGAGAACQWTTSTTSGLVPMIVVTAGDRRDNRIAIYRLDEVSRRLVEVAARKLHPGVATYGSCMYHSRSTGRHYYIVTSKTGAVEQ